MKIAFVLGHPSYGTPLIRHGYTLIPIHSYLNTPAAKPPKVMPSLVVFTGGHDLNPKMYKEAPKGASGWSDERDEFEEEWFMWCMEHKIPMLGICRGLQLFTVLTGGKLHQHVEGHYGEHKILTDKGELVHVNSLHHQTCIPQDKTCKVLARSYYEIENNLGYISLEAGYFPEVKALGVQWHPEMMNPTATASKYFDTLLKEYIES